MHRASGLSMKRHGCAKQLVVFFGAATIGTGGGWGADAVLRACRKVVCRPRGKDQDGGKVVLVDEHRTSRVSSAVNGKQPCEVELNTLSATRPAGWKPPAGQVEQRLVRPAWSQERGQPVRGLMWCPVVAPRKPPQAPRSSQAATQPAASEPGPSTPPPAKRSKRTKAEQGKAAKAKPAPQPGRWLDRDCNAALNMPRIGESRWRPLELCYWPEQGALPAKGKEYPEHGYKRLRDKPPKAQQQQQPAVAQILKMLVDGLVGLRDMIPWLTAFRKMRIPTAAAASLLRNHATAAHPIAPSNIWCVGRNYAEHIKELGSTGSTDGEPMIFLKAGSSALASGQPLVLPPWSSDVHHEVELALELGPDLQPVRGCVALDLTARDVQCGHWVAAGEAEAAAVALDPGQELPLLHPPGHPLQPARQVARRPHPHTLALGLVPTLHTLCLDPQDLELHLSVNGVTRQRSSTRHMIFKVADLLGYVRDRFPCMPGDLLLTGTPEGVSAMQAGDKVEAQVLGPQGQLLSQGSWQVMRR
ncbi:hypothetical protein QJQ45_018983 [Haematococcus lacustris]|nr:hypothetical protein QJQ45_018983 [Haematococcus lacustris]